jgi:hypothetical protein
MTPGAFRLFAWLRDLEFRLMRWLQRIPGVETFYGDRLQHAVSLRIPRLLTFGVLLLLGVASSLGSRRGGTVTKLIETVDPE